MCSNPIINERCTFGEHELTPFVLRFPNLSSEDDKVAVAPIGTLKELDKMTASSLVTALTPKKSCRSIE